jgi:Uma2 family endonuclease
MGLLDNYGKGPHNLGMTPRPAYIHQDIMNMILINLSYLDKKGKIVVRTENPVIKKPKEIVPDLCIYRNKGTFSNQVYDPESPVVVIEIEKSSRIKSNIKNLSELLEIKKTIKEAFVYDYEKNKWYQIKGTISLENPPSYSHILGVNLADLTFSRLG